ncbi:MAG TPA: leucyl aminopeptidase, partial [Chroococcales cyanobacterium]
NAFRPSDILNISGKTVEIGNTDAEGRLILADALAYAKRFDPAATIDLATLTGACVVALGSHVTGMMGNDDDLKSKIKKAGEEINERVWELPLWDEYSEQLKSDVADFKNVGGRWGGAITAAAFLSKFAEGPWVHLDIAGTSREDKGRPYTPKGGSGVGVRLLAKLVSDWK